MSKYRYVGKPYPRRDIDKITGEAEFAYDFELPGMLWVKLVGSPYPHARIVSIDYSDALRVPGVVRVFTGKDFPFKIGKHLTDRDVLARDKALYYGHPVVAVVAESLEAAEEAASKIQIEYEPLPAVFEPDEAAKPGAPILHPDLGKYRRLPFIRPKPGTNIADHFKLRKGNIEEGFAKADIVVENTYRLPMLHHAWIEPWAAVALARRDGVIEVWSTTQGPFAIRDQLAYSFGIPPSKIIVHYMYIGGGFGGKSDLMLEPIPVAIALKLKGRPIKLMLNREEVFYFSYHRPKYVIKMRTGATKDGRLVAHYGEYYLGTGAYADLGTLMGQTIGFLATGPYDIPHVWIDSYTVYTNTPSVTAFRGYTHSELYFAFEQQMDELAERLGIDPVEFRLKNIWKPGLSETPTGQKLSEDMGDPGGTLRRAAELIEWGKPPEKPKYPWRVRAKGIAVCPKGPSQPSSATSSAIVKLNEDGTVDVLVGTVEIGTGTLSALTQIVAEELGIPPEMVNVYIDRTTANAPYDWQTVASRSLFVAGQSVLRALEDVKSQIKSVVSKIFNVEEYEVEVRDGKACVVHDPSKCVELRDLATGYVLPDGRTIHGPIIGRGSHTPGTTALNEQGRGRPWLFITFATAAVEVEVDLLTGRVEVLKSVLVADTPVINPLLALGQGYGGTVMGVSLALFEEIKFDEEGRILNPNLTDYKILRVKDIPKQMIFEFLGKGQSNAPYGAKGIGELMMIGWPAAIANALARALGVRFRELPMSPERIIEKVRKERPDLLKKALSSLG